MTSHSTRARRTAAALLFVPIAVVAAGCGRSGPDAATEEPAPAGGAITLFTDSTELFMEHPALIVGAPEKFAVHLTDLTDFAPLRSGRITMRFTPRDGGEPLVVVQEAPRAPGIYGPAPDFTKAGVYDLTILVESPQARDSISVPELRVYATAAQAPLESEEEAGGISFLKEQQWKTDGFRTAFAVTGTVAETFEVPGDVRAADGHLAEVVAPAGGVLEVAGLSEAPIVGQRVEKGQVLARMTPALGASGATFADARARLREAEDEYERAKRLFAAEAIPERRLHEAEIRLTAAREALAGLGGGTLTADGRVAVVAPISGLISQRSLTPGARVEAGTPLFTIVESSVVWVTAHIPAAQVARLDRRAAATVLVEGAMTPLRTSRLLAVGSVIDVDTRTVPVTYELADREGIARVGAVARVNVPTAARLEGVVVPAAAVLEEDGRPFVFVQLGGELFVRRDVTVESTDGLRTLVRTGLTARERVVTGAAYQLKLASMSTAVPAHGHEH